MDGWMDGWMDGGMDGWRDGGFYSRMIRIYVEMDIFVKIKAVFICHYSI